jgi:hypothetical protein
MKKFLIIIVLISFGMAGCYSTHQIPSRDYDNDEYNTGYENDGYNTNDRYNAEVSYQVFYDQLQPYGNWINYPGYGYVWQPNAGMGFRPYETNGRWVSTVEGWAWASNYSWGWAPFHYGRWLNDPRIGWAWVPGYEWAPAWVTWGRYNDYYAWAPLAPGINISIGNSWQAPYDYWSCVPQNRIYQSNLTRYVTRPDRNNIVNNITIINNYNTYNQQNYYNKGPEYQEVERITRRKITPLPIASANSPAATNVNERQIRIYRPSVTNNADVKTAAPARIVTLDEVKILNSRRAGVRGDIQRPSAQPGVTGQLERNNSSLDDKRNDDVNGTSVEGSRRRKIVRPSDNNDGVYNGQQPSNNLPENLARRIIRPQQMPPGDQPVNSERRVIRPQQLPRTTSPANNERPVIGQQQLPPVDQPRRERRIIRPQQLHSDQPVDMERPLMREQQPRENNQRANTGRRMLDDLFQQDNSSQNRPQPVFPNSRNNRQVKISAVKLTTGLINSGR